MASLSVIDALSAGWRMKDGAEPAGNTGKALRGFNPTPLRHIHTSNHSTWQSVCFSDSPRSLTVCPPHHPFMVPFMSVVLSLHQHLDPRKWKQAACPPAVLLIGLSVSQVAFQPVYEPVCTAAPHFHSLFTHSSFRGRRGNPRKWLEWALNSHSTPSCDEAGGAL